MPRNGDGSSDNGPIETGQNLTHGSKGDTTLKRTGNVAPMPEVEKGEALDGLNASGGGSANPTNPGGSGKGADSNKPPPVDEATNGS